MHARVHLHVNKHICNASSRTEMCIPAAAASLPRDVMAWGGGLWEDGKVVRGRRWKLSRRLQLSLPVRCLHRILMPRDNCFLSASSRVFRSPSFPAATQPVHAVAFLSLPLFLLISNILPALSCAAEGKESLPGFSRAGVIAFLLGSYWKFAMS